MDPERFDTLARSLTAIGSRRRALALALSSALAHLLTRGDATAHDTLKKCKKKSGKQKKKCIKKAKNHNAQDAANAAPLPPPPPPFCVTNPKFTPCQTGGPNCFCDLTVGGASICIAASSKRGVANCGLCTGNGEICLDRDIDLKWCGVACVNPR
jgi:hypothetical protein